MRSSLCSSTAGTSPSDKDTNCLGVKHPAGWGGRSSLSGWPWSPSSRGPGGVGESKNMDLGLAHSGCPWAGGLWMVRQVLGTRWDGENGVDFRGLVHAWGIAPSLSHTHTHTHRWATRIYTLTCAASPWLYSFSVTASCSVGGDASVPKRRQSLRFHSGFVLCIHLTNKNRSSHCGSAGEEPDIVSMKM